MTTSHTPALTQPERTKRQERAERILNAAEELLLRHGYRRITIDDIANQTGIGKGTIYLHWKSKEALFSTLFLREAVAIWSELLARLRADPTQVLFSQVLRSMLLVGMQRPFARAFFTRDRELLGKLLEGEIGPGQGAELAMGQTEFLDLLRSQGLIRSDGDLNLQAHAIRAVVNGFLITEPGPGETQPLSLEQRAEALAQTIHAAFEPAELPAPEKLQETAATMTERMQGLIAAFGAKIQEHMVP